MTGHVCMTVPSYSAIGAELLRRPSGPPQHFKLVDDNSDVREY